MFACGPILYEMLGKMETAHSILDLTAKEQTGDKVTYFFNLQITKNC